MLRVGLTGGLGSGKSTVGAMLAEHGAYVISADEIGRELMAPGQSVHAAIAKRFGPGVVREDGTLDRGELARLAFAEGRVEELNAIVHPAVIAREAELTEEIGLRDGAAVVVVESALIFETRFGRETRFGEETGFSGGWRNRFDRMVLVTAPESLKVARFVERASKAGRGGATGELEADARRRLAQQISDERKRPMCDFVIENAGGLGELKVEVEALWPVLAREAREQQRL